MADGIRSRGTPPTRRAPGGFSLPELLVVIGILAVLIAILLPVVVRAREHANAARCAANLRVLGQALAAYTTQSGHYPGALTSGDRAVWPTRLRAVLGGSQHVFYCPSRDPEYAWTPGLIRSRIDGSAEPAPFGDPGYGYLASERYFSGAGLHAPFSYGYNAFGTDLVHGKRGLGGWLLYQNRVIDDYAMTELRATRVRMPAATIALCDGPTFEPVPWTNCFVATPVRWVAPSITPIGWTAPSPIHSGGTNVLFCDGHVQRYPTPELLLPDNSRPTTERNRSVARMWNADHEP